MTMSNMLYTKQVKCPICNNDFSSHKVKKSACMVDKRDEDFCTYYKAYNPLFYEIFVCPSCGYAAAESSFSELTKQEIKTLRDSFSGFEVKRSFCGERNLADAIASFKIALFTNNSKQSKSSIIAGICLKLAWLYRYEQDYSEHKFLKFALDNYIKAYNVEEFPIGNFDEITMQYLIGELSRRLGNKQDAVFWFAKAVSNPERKANPKIENMARDQWLLAKEEMKNLKKVETL